MGMGGGRGWGRGIGMPGFGGSGIPFGTPWEQGSGNEIEMLRAQAEALKSQLDQITRRIDELEKSGDK